MSRYLVPLKKGLDFPQPSMPQNVLLSSKADWKSCQNQEQWMYLRCTQLACRKKIVSRILKIFLRLIRNPERDYGEFTRRKVR